VNRLKRDLGPHWKFLPEGALRHDPNAYLNANSAVTLALPRAAGSRAAAG